MTAIHEHTAVVLSGGGERIVAWQIGVLAGLLDAGDDLRGAATIIGTSAGALVAARLALGDDLRIRAGVLERREPTTIPTPEHAPFELFAQAFAAAGSVPAGRRRMGAAALTADTRLTPDESIALAAQRVPETEWPAALRLVTVDARLGERFVIDRTAEVPPAVGVAASRAVPGLFPAVHVAGRALIDGAIGSATNADIALDHDPDRVVIISAFPHEDRHATLRALCQEALDTEVAALTARGIEVTLIQATDADMDAMGPDPMNAAAAPLAARAGQAHGRAVSRPLPPRPLVPSSP